MAETKILRCGPAGWSRPDWDRTVYPAPKPRGFHPLEYLSQYFDVVEIDATFYRDVRPEVARLWASRVERNAAFRFTARLHRKFTHDRCLADREVASFRRGLRPLVEAGKLGAVLMQFPWAFRYTEENRDFLIRLCRAFHEFPLVAEMRHSSWMREEALGTLIDYHVGIVNIDQPSRTNAMPPAALLTSPVGYVRLHGRNQGRWMQEFDDAASSGERSDYLYTPVELEEWRDRVERIRRFADSVYVITTNGAGGRSLVNALQLKALSEQPVKRVPRMLVRTYRREMEAFRPDGTVQTCLFEGHTPARAVA